MSYTFDPIGIVHSCFKEKFGIPRQPGLIPEAEGRLEILPPYNRPEAFRQLDGYSHLWITFVFHAAIREQWSPTVRPPRLGGNQRVGVFASRSPFRPNPIGLSVVKLHSISCSQDQFVLHLGGIDLLDGTPVLDIKPYLPYSDAIPDAHTGYAPEPPAHHITLTFSAQAESILKELPRSRSDHLRRLIQQILANDPRPAYLQADTSLREFGMQLYDYNIRWQVGEDRVCITRIEQLTDH